jgi:DNA (cytosine-5)-methyltransferase 1
MRQPTLRGVCARKRARAPAERMKVVDLFCGAGGFSTGAVAAGHEVVLAVDFDEGALETHARNHPNTIHLRRTLPCALPLPVGDDPFHLHGSPPCQRFSQMNRTNRVEGDRAEATFLLCWYIEFALASEATSWSMEQVATPGVLEVVERKRHEHRGAFSYHVFHFDTLGVPQTRVRLIAGSPHIVARLLRARETQPRRGIKDVIAEPRAKFVRGGNVGVHKRKVKCFEKREDDGRRYRRTAWDEMTRRLDQPAPTICGGHIPNWIGEDDEGMTRSVLNVEEIAALQTFPPTYLWPERKVDAAQQIGNGIPPHVAQLMLTDTEW